MYIYICIYICVYIYMYTNLYDIISQKTRIFTVKQLRLLAILCSSVVSVTV